MPALVKIFLFDLDGTLINGAGAGMRALELACRQEFGLEGATSGVVFDGMTDLAIVRAILEPRGRGGERNLQRLIQAYLEHLPRTVAEASGYRVLEGVVETLDYLEKKGRLYALATGNVVEGARIKLERGGLWGRFPTGGFGSDAEERVQIVKTALERARKLLGDDSAQAVVVGDTPRDVRAACGAGLPALAVASGRFSVAELKAAGAELVLESLCQPEVWLERLDRILAATASDK
jgi:phosphoglycolate phosphatase